MSRPEPRLVAKILSLPDVQALGITHVYPIKIPQGEPYPGIVYQVLEDTPNSPADGRCLGHTLRIRVTCLARTTSGVPGYQAIRTLASAVEGDSSPTTEPSGISGWQDDEGQCWIKERSQDGLGTIMDGSDEFEAYVIDQFYFTAYTLN